MEGNHSVWSQVWFCVSWKFRGQWFLCCCNGTGRVQSLASTLRGPVWTPAGGSTRHCNLVWVDPVGARSKFDLVERRREGQLEVLYFVLLTWPKYDTLTKASPVCRFWCSSRVTSAAYGGHFMSKISKAMRQGIRVVSWAEYRNIFLLREWYFKRLIRFV